MYYFEPEEGAAYRGIEQRAEAGYGSTYDK